MAACVTLRVCQRVWRVYRGSRVTVYGTHYGGTRSCGSRYRCSREMQINIHQKLLFVVSRTRGLLRQSGRAEGCAECGLGTCMKGRADGHPHVLRPHIISRFFAIFRRDEREVEERRAVNGRVDRDGTGIP